MKVLLPIAIALCSMSANVSADTLTFGIVPQQSPLKMFKSWKPITKYLSEKTGHKIVFKTICQFSRFCIFRYRTKHGWVRWRYSTYLQ